MFTINDDVKTFIQNEKGNLRPKVILNLVSDTIAQMLAYNLPKSYILNYINKELGTNINYQTFNSYLKKHKGFRPTHKRPTSVKQTATGADGFFAKLRGDGTAGDSAPGTNNGGPKILGTI